MTPAPRKTYSVNLGSDIVGAGEPVAVAYTYRTITPVNGHLLQLRVDQPTKALAVELDSSDTDLSSVTVLDFIASSQRTRIAQTPPTLPGKVMAVDFDGWVFPRSGVAFVWSYDAALPPAGRSRPDCEKSPPSLTTRNSAP